MNGGPLEAQLWNLHRMISTPDMKPRRQAHGDISQLCTSRSRVPDTTPSVVCCRGSPCSQFDDDAHKGIGSASLRPVDCEVVYDFHAQNPYLERPYLKSLQYGVAEWVLLKSNKHPNSSVHDLSQENWDEMKLF